MNSRTKSRNALLASGIIVGLGVLFLASRASAVEMGNGIKVGEASPTSIVVWTRLTRDAEGNFGGTPFPKEKSQNRRSTKIADLTVMEGSCPGTQGETRVTYWPTGEESQSRTTEWLAVDPKSDFTHQFHLENLRPGTRYTLRAEGRPPGGSTATCQVEGGFSTAPEAERITPVRFAVITCQDYHRKDTPKGHKIYPLMQEMSPDFFVHTGDVEYYDKPEPYADSQELARFKWNRLYALPYERSFHNVTTSYFMKDDHDTLCNDCWPGQSYGDLTWEQGLAIFREQVPMSEKPYRTVRWGQDLQIWLVDGREFRSPNSMPDGPDKTIWGQEQKRWFFDTVKASDATFKILISPTPIVGPDRESKNDNLANEGFQHEGDEIRAFLGRQKNMFVICGDRHWQYVSEDPQTGVKEFACGPASDSHASGFKEENRSPMHKYLKIKGGFLLVEIKRVDGQTQALMTHYGVDGSVYNQVTIPTTLK